MNNMITISGGDYSINVEVRFKDTPIIFTEKDIEELIEILDEELIEIIELRIKNAK